LEKLRENGNGGKKLSWEKPMWCYRRVQEYAEYKALMEGIRTIYVDPAGTSRRSPNGKKLKFVNYRLVQLGGAITSRDVVASWNLALRGLQRMRGSRVRWSPDSPRSEAMKTRAKRGSPEVEKYLNNYSYSQMIASGKP
jgi:putative transposase